MTTITPQILLKAYCAGIFPMAESADNNALYWVEPELRGVIPLNGFHVSRSLARMMRAGEYSITVDEDFKGVIAGCAGASGSGKAPISSNEAMRRDSTWINARIRALYTQLHDMGCCHSVECRDETGKLVGGLYGVRIGAAFFGESMFSLMPNASKLALVHLVARLKAGGFRLLDTQFVTDHLKTFGCQEVPKDDYLTLLDDALVQQADFFGFAQDGDREEVLRLARLTTD